MQVVVTKHSILCYLFNILYLPHVTHIHIIDDETAIRISKRFQVMKMKNKLGTRQLPTAELLLDGCKAELMGEEGKGVANISNMLTITRLHNTLAAVSAMR